jgi:hypothetical protein
MSRVRLLCGMLCGVGMGVAIASIVAIGPSQNGAFTISPILGGEAVRASGAITSSEDAIALALDWIPSSEAPHDAIARLVPANVVGELFHQCVGWDSDDPYWVVGVYTDATWQYGMEGVSASYAYSTTQPKHPNAEGVYLVYNANNGKNSAYGDLINGAATNNYGMPSYQDIYDLDDDELSIGYQTPEVEMGASTETPGSNFEATPDRAATNVVRQADESACREEWWPGWPTSTPTPTPTNTPTLTPTPTATRTRTPTPCPFPNC